MSGLPFTVTLQKKTVLIANSLPSSTGDGERFIDCARRQRNLDPRRGAYLLRVLLHACLVVRGAYLLLRVSSSQRRLVLHHVQPSRWKSKAGEVENDVCDEEVGSEQVMSFGYMFSGEGCAVVGLESDLNEFGSDDVLL